jgi:putative cell wall-binding protein
MIKETLVSVRRFKIAGSTVAGLVALSLAATTVMATSAAAATSIVRLGGADRFATSAAIVQANYKPGVPVVYIATGLNFPDALAGGAAAAKAGGPLLLVQPDSIPAETSTELTRLTPASIVVLGGTAAVSDAVQATLKTYTSGPVTRVSGADRYTTAANLTASFPTGSPVFVATGTTFPDALAGTAAAANQHAAILLTSPAILPAVTAAALTALAPSSITILGGTSAVSTAVETQLSTYSSAVTRLSGVDRYATAAAIATSAFPGATSVFITTGAGFADALTGGPVAGGAGQPLLLATSTCLPAATAAVVAAHTPATVTLLGGTDALGAGVASLTTCTVPGISLTTRVLTSDGADTADISLADGVVTMSAPLTNNSLSNLRTIFWPTGEASAVDEQVCATWLDQSGIVQQGVALRIIDGPNSIRALTVTKNVVYGVEWVFNVHTWDTTRPEPFTGIGQYDMGQVVMADNQYLPFPWRICARAIGAELTFKVWLPDREAEPSWSDPIHARTMTVPNDFLAPGETGWYIGHISAGGSAHYGSLGTWPGNVPSP